ncbi:MAG: ImmA/IrrE family metallo-endopeptidase [Thiotrichaceae bacterium]|nr:ImmA/IrrE family metallo-endopeptidase [Thiotrichaceae bacterium]
MKARIIKTESDYNEAMARLSELMDAEENSADEAELELLALIIEDYERKNVPAPEVSPIDAILFRMDQMGLRQKDLIPYIGSLSKVSEVLSGKRSLSLNMIRQLHRGLGISAEVLIADSNILANELKMPTCEDYAQYPIAELDKRGCFDKFKEQRALSISGAQLLDYAEELMRNFFESLNIRGKAPTFLRAPQHQNGDKNMNDFALTAWLGCVLKKARAAHLSGTYQSGLITDEFLSELVRLSRFEQGPLLAQEFLAQHGIALVIEPHFPKTYLDGAALMDGDIPVVGLTLRHDRLDNFWFVLLHELIHVQKHLNQDISYITDDLDDKVHANQFIEKEANESAKNALIPLEKWAKSEVRFEYTPENAKQLATELRIHEAIVAGRVRYESGDWRLLSGMLGRKQVYKLFEYQISPVDSI